MEKKKSKTAGSFSGKVAANSRKQIAESKSIGYLMLPKGIDMFKEAADTKALIDIMPYVVSEPKHPDRDEELGIAEPGTLWYKRPYKLHRNVGPNKESVVCPTSVGKKCPICEYRAAMMAESEYDEEEARALRPSPRNLYVVIPIKRKGFNGNYDQKPYIWDISQNNFQKALNDEIKENDRYGGFPELENGFTLCVRFSEEAIGKNKYAEVSRIDFEERTEPYGEEIMEDIPDLDKILKVLTYDQLEDKFNGRSEEDEAEEAAEEERAVKRAEAAERAARRTEDEDESEDEAPRKRKSAESEDEAPRKRKSAESEDDEPKKKGSGAKCPSGHKFGNDCEEYSECNDCDLWSDCIKAQRGR